MTGMIVEFILLLVAHAAAGMYSATLKYRKKLTLLIWGTWIVLQSSLMLYAELVLMNPILKFFFGFVLAFFGQYVIFFMTTKGRLGQRVFTILTYSIFFCTLMVFFQTIKGAFEALPPILMILILALMLLVVVYYFLHYVCALCHAAAKNITNGWSLLIFVNIVFLIMLIWSSVFPVRLTSVHDPAFVTFVFLSLLILSVYPVIFSNINSMSEAATKREVERQNKLLLTQIESEKHQLEADSRARHDRRHHNLVMLELANNNDMESVREYLRNLVESESKAWGEERHCDHTTVNTVLTVYERRARENRIDVNISADVSRELDVSPQDLVIVIANLFENAVNAAAKTKKTPKYIDIYIKESAKRLLIKIENSCRETFSFDESYYGVGIRSIIATAGKYDGMYDFSAEDGIFSAKVSLNLK